MSILGDGFRFTMRHPETNSVVFQGDLVQQQCAAQTKSKTRCLRHTSVGKYCYQHRRLHTKLAVRKSNVANAGNGLFVASTDHGPNEIVFRKGARLLHYEGEELSLAEVEERYGQHTAPYGLQTSRTTATDAALERGLASQANSQRRLRDCNARLSVNRDGEGLLMATTNIRNGAEVLVWYGVGYEYDSVHKKSYVRPGR
jgi:hypothetical protein